MKMAECLKTALEVLFGIIEIFQKGDAKYIQFLWWQSNVPGFNLYFG